VAQVPPTECIQTYRVRNQQRLLLAYHSGRRFSPDDASCNWLLMETRRRGSVPEAPPGWVKQWDGARPGDRSERFLSVCPTLSNRASSPSFWPRLGRRMGGVDKGLIEYQGRPLIEWALAALMPQVDQLVISANRNLDTYAAYGHRVLSDTCPTFPAHWPACLQRSRPYWPTGCWWCRVTPHTCRPTSPRNCSMPHNTKTCRWP